jgi:hypothetical protein
MPRASKVSARALLFLLVLSLLATPGLRAAGPAQAELPVLIKELQKISQKNNRMVLVWWIPEDFWRLSFANSGRMTAEQGESFLAVLRPYLLIGVVDGSMGPLGGMTYRSEEETRKQLTVIDRTGREYRPTPDDQISGDLRNLLGMMKPMLVNMLGPTGENFHFFVFPAKDSSGKLLAEPKSEGKLAVRLGEESFEWRLPLGSLLPAKMCPQDNEMLNGAWTYCPWHGVKLVEAPPKS